MSKKKKPPTIADFLKFQKEQEGILTITLAAQYSGYTRESIWQNIKKETIQAYHIGKIWLVGFKSLEEYAKRKNRLNYSHRRKKAE